MYCVYCYVIFKFLHEISIGPNNRIQHAYNEADFTNGGLYNQTSFSQVSDYRFLWASSFFSPPLTEDKIKNV